MLIWLVDIKHFSLVKPTVYSTYMCTVDLDSFKTFNHCCVYTNLKLKIKKKNKTLILIKDIDKLIKPCPVSNIHD